MINFFEGSGKYFAVESDHSLNDNDLQKLTWLFGNARLLPTLMVAGKFIGPRKEMITPWSTNAVEITQNMGIRGIKRIEEFTIYDLRFTIGNLQSTNYKVQSTPYDSMLEQVYNGLEQDIFTIYHTPEPVCFIDDIAAYNLSTGLALSPDEIGYLELLSRKLGRRLTDSEVFGFSQVNSEHCRHKIFNGTFIIDEKEMPETLFGMIRKTSKEHPRLLVSAYSDNVAFIEGPEIEQFAPRTQDKPDYFFLKKIQSVLSLKAETHNFPTTVEPFNGAATGSGGEIRDRMAGGKGSIPLAGTAVYMTSYPRIDGGRSWEKKVHPRNWLYKNPEEILVKASNGASDFGNKFGQPVICGSVLTFEHEEDDKTYGYDKVIMLAGGIGFARREDSLKEMPDVNQKVIILGGDNYRIGMGGGAVSSVATGEYHNAIELNAVQRSNPEMQKRVFNAIRAMTEADHNPIVSIHDHGAGGHLNSISELIESTGGVIDINALPLGDPTLSAKEIISNESQERMGLLLDPKDVPLMKKIAERERAPIYEAGETTGDHQLVFTDRKAGTNPIDLKIEDFFGKPPKTVIRDMSYVMRHTSLVYEKSKLHYYLNEVLQLESVACKDWLTNKVDRAVSGKIAKQQTCGTIQLPLNNLGVTALDYKGEKGIATSIGHAPVAALIDAEAGSRLSIAEALTNLVWAPLTHGLNGVSLSANWMWPCKNPGEDARLYAAVKAASDFAIQLGLNIPTGKDSLSMTQKYPDGSVVISPGTVIISAVGEVSDVKKVISPALIDFPGSMLVYMNFSGGTFELGGSSFAQVINQLGERTPDILDAAYFAKAFNAVQKMINAGMILSGHDISSGGLITTLLEMTFPVQGIGMDLDFTTLRVDDPVKLLFSENPGIVIQVKELEQAGKLLDTAGIKWHSIGKAVQERQLNIRNGNEVFSFDIDPLRDTWFKTSYLLDRLQSGPDLALERFSNYKNQPLDFSFPGTFTGKAQQYGIDLNRETPTGIKAAVIREKGINRDRDAAWALYLAGFDVKDVHMTDLISGRESLDDLNFIVFAGGFSNSDVLGSAKGWAGAFLYNEKAKETLERFYKREDTLSLGICNGCQLMVELGVLYPETEGRPYMSWNDSHKYECTFVTVDVQENHSVMLKSLAGSRLGIWSAHGEGKFNFPHEEDKYHIPAKFLYSSYPGNPNGSQYDAACVASTDGRHLAIMPHLEDSVMPWQWAHYPGDRESDEVTPWVEAFVNARRWVENK
ncbi:MAG: phosphoribosylformylglycinamidine synthase [Bacteroidetes bacterium]|nr:phosphoribosylformylglycinamidine synthase [Bacteroidota bacterium]